MHSVQSNSLLVNERDEQICTNANCGVVPETSAMQIASPCCNNHETLDITTSSLYRYHASVPSTASPRLLDRGLGCASRSTTPEPANARRYRSRFCLLWLRLLRRCDEFTRLLFNRGRCRRIAHWSRKRRGIEDFCTSRYCFLSSFLSIRSGCFSL